MEESIFSGQQKYENYKEQFNQVLEWKEERNRLIHALLKQQFAHNEIGELAFQGNELVKKLRSRATSYNRAVEKEKVSK